MWEKKGLIFNVKGEFDWNKTHAQVPVVDVLNNFIRIYYSTRNNEGISTISYIEVDRENPSRILYIHDSPILELGKLGAFDDSGVMPTSVVTIGEKKYLYYIGWTTRGTVPYHNGIGVALSEDGGKTFKRLFEGPIITVNKYEPYFSGTAFVMCDENIFKMYYLSCIGWEKRNDKIEPFYEIKYAESSDGIDWNQLNHTCISLSEGEGGIVSATLIKTLEGKYKMWYGVRSDFDYRENTEKSYRIGYAESENGLDWIRMDEKSGISVSTEGWDSQMISYPFVVDNRGKKYMFYNGNFFGKSGFGYAIWYEK